MNYEEIIKVLEEKVEDVSEFAYEDYDSVELGLGVSTEIAHRGGEDMGSDWYSIKHFVDHDVYIKVSGWYQSHHGTDFDGWADACSEVRPVEKTVTVYE